MVFVTSVKENITSRTSLPSFEFRLELWQKTGFRTAAVKPKPKLKPKRKMNCGSQKTLKKLQKNNGDNLSKNTLRWSSQTVTLLKLCFIGKTI